MARIRKQFELTTHEMAEAFASFLIQRGLISATFTNRTLSAELIHERGKDDVWLITISDDAPPA